eukprot:scaffold95812_cov69-Phaeocystis_antarctica.AAC.1
MMPSQRGREAYRGGRVPDDDDGMLCGPGAIGGRRAEPLLDLASVVRGIWCSGACAWLCVCVCRGRVDEQGGSR